ncbi:MAG: thiamine phosphate synthase [Candidatus Eisenbacteria bacterium]|nr:thiamine phosphate synthase [Candidatus Eisenbacteria bacterium]
MHDGFDPTLYAILDLTPDGPMIGIDRACHAVTGGVTLFQLRGKGVPARRLWTLAREMVRQLSPLGVPLIVNDRADVARAAGAQGVHLGQSDLPAVLVRRAWPEAIIGVSIHNMSDLEAARIAGASYVASGSLFATGTKPDATPLTGEMLRSLAAAADRPLVAIGGITLENAAIAAELGADGIAVISGLWSAPDVALRAGALRAAFESGRG